MVRLGMVAAYCLLLFRSNAEARHAAVRGDFHQNPKGVARSVRVCTNRSCFASGRWALASPWAWRVGPKGPTFYLQ